MPLPPPDSAIQILDSDDDDDDNSSNKFNKSKLKINTMDDDDDVVILPETETTPTVMPITGRKRPRSRPKSPIPDDLCYVVDSDPTPPPSKIPNSASSHFTASFVPETPIPPFNNPELPSSSSSPEDDDLICLASDDVPKCMARNSSLKNIGACVGSESFDVEDRSPDFASVAKQLENRDFVPDFDVDSWLDLDSTCFLHKGMKSNVQVEGEESLGKRSCMQDDVHVEQDLEERRNFVAQEYCQDNGNLEFSKTYDNTHLEDSINQEQPDKDYDYERENVIVEKVNGKKKRNINSQAAADRKKAREEKNYKKEQEKLQKAKLKEEAAKLKGLKQLEKAVKKLEKYKFSEKDIVAEVDQKVLSGSLGGPLLTMFTDKKLSREIKPNTIAKSVVWRMKLPEGISQEGISQLFTVNTNIQYILLIYDNAEEFCNHANDGSLLHHIASVRKQFPSYTICCLTNRLMSFINKREQQKYKNHKDAHDWRRPPVEELFAKLTTQFDNVHTRQCADEVEVAEHVVGLTINLARCHSRKKLSHLSVNANGCNVPKDCVDRERIMKTPWLKALISIPKVQPRFAVAIWKQYPTMKSLLRVYMDPTKTVDEKESVLQDLPLDDLLGNRVKVLGKKCSMRVYRILMAHNGSIKTDDVEDGADFTPSQ